MRATVCCRWATPSIRFQEAASISLLRQRHPASQQTRHSTAAWRHRQPDRLSSQRDRFRHPHRLGLRPHRGVELDRLPRRGLRLDEREPCRSRRVPVLRWRRHARDDHRLPRLPGRHAGRHRTCDSLPQFLGRLAQRPRRQRHRHRPGSRRAPSPMTCLRIACLFNQRRTNMLRTILSTLVLLFAFGTAAHAAQPCCDEGSPCCEDASPCCDE